MIRELRIDVKPPVALVNRIPLHGVGASDKFLDVSPPVRFKQLSLFFLSSTLIAYELFVMRTFSIGSWSNFGVLVISTALLGFGLAGTTLTFIRDRVKNHTNRWLELSSIAFIPAMSLAHAAAQWIPFEPVFIGSDGRQILWIGLYYFVYSVPFFLSALFIGTAFIALSSRIHRLYFWNMAGSGAGGLLFILLLFGLEPDRILLPLLVMAYVASILSMVRHDPYGKRLFIRPAPLIVSTCLLLAAVVLHLWIGDIKVSEYKAVSYVRKYPDAGLMHHTYGPTGEMHIYWSSFLHFAPGLSDNAALDVEGLPEQPFAGLYIDGNGPIGIMGALSSSESRYLDYLPMSAPYSLLDEPEVLLVNLGGGLGAAMATHNGARNVTVVEANPEIVNLLERTPAVAAFNDDLLSSRGVQVLRQEPRAHSSTTDSRYDLVEISLVDSIGLSETGGYAVQENFTYTEEAISDYLSCLKPDGLLSITVWNRLTPPRNVLKVLTTVVSALKKEGFPNPGDHLFVFDLFLSTSTVLIKKSVFTDEEILSLESYCRKMSFDLIYHRNIQPRDKDLNQLLAGYRSLFADGTSETEDTELLSSDMYNLALTELLKGSGPDLYRNYIFDIRPMTDDRPYYSAYLKTRDLPMYLDQVQDIAEEWGYLILLGILVQSLLFGILIILLPVAGRWRELFSRNKGTLAVIAYFACLGLGYMLIEITLIQRLVFFLGNPTYSAALVITAMLVISGLGSLYSRRWAARKAVRLASAGICLSILFYLFALSPVLNLLLGAPLITRAVLAIFLIAPSAFFLGMPFPSGLSALSVHRPPLLPWAWGMNGALSVTGTVLASLVSIAAGFRTVLIAAAVIYAAVAFLFPANEATAQSS